MNKSILLNHAEITLKLDRIAWQILEHHVDSDSIVLVGLIDRGAEVAKKIKTILQKHSTKNILHTTINVNKDAPLESPIDIENPTIIQHNSVVLVDDVLNSGTTLVAALREVLAYTPKSVMTAVLANRDHHKFPIQANFVGLSLSTTLKEHILFEEKNGKMCVYLC